LQNFKDREGDASQLNRLIFLKLTTLARDQGLKPHCLGRGVFPGLKSGASTSKASTIGLIIWFAPFDPAFGFRVCPE